MTVTVAVNGVEKSYGAVKALRNVSFDLGPGRLSALVGHNGAGKTTLIKLMLGLIHAERGAVRVLDEDPAAGEFSARRQLGYLPENVAFNAALTGRETLAFYARLKQIKPASAWPLLDRVGLMHAADRRVGTYSKGMRQRLGLAQALLGRPRVLLLDEPTTGLDPALRQTFYEILERIARRRRHRPDLLARAQRARGSRRACPDHEPRASGRAGHAGGTALDLATADPGLARSCARRQRPAGLDERGECRDARTAASCWCPMRPARWSCCASRPAIPASPTSRSRRRRSTISTPTFLRENAA